MPSDQENFKLKDAMFRISNILDGYEEKITKARIKEITGRKYY